MQLNSNRLPSEMPIPAEDLRELKKHAIRLLKRNRLFMRVFIEQRQTWHLAARGDDGSVSSWPLSLTCRN